MSVIGSEADLLSSTASVRSDPYVNATRRLHMGVPEMVTLGLYVGLLIWAFPHHEPWADEAQAWQLARTLPFAQMFRLLSYEGHPGLWYVLLWALSRLHVSYTGMRCVAAVIAFAGISVLVATSPFPRFVKLLLPFSFYLAFQYAIVARSYVLAPLLLFLCACFWTRRPRRPLAVALCLGLLANVALHAAVISAGLAIVYLIDLWLERRAGNLSLAAGKLFTAVFLLLALYALSIWTAWPAKTVGGAGLVIHTVGAPNQTPEALEAQQSLLPPRYPPPQPENRRSLRWVVWELEKGLTAGLTEGLIAPFWLGCLFWVLLTWKLFLARRLHYLIPAIFLVVFCHVYAFFWHSGLMLPCVIALMWMTWPARESARNLPFRKLPLYEQLPLWLLLLIALVQISWAEFAFRFDEVHDYASARQAAAFLKPYVVSNTRILAIGNDSLSTGVQAYFESKVFLNEPFRYYWWSTLNPSKLRYRELLAQGAEIVVLEWRFRDYPTGGTVAAIPLAQQLTGLGYRNTHTFCGGLVGPRREILEWNCDLIYQPQK
jgi:hypothetical protein